MDKEAKTKWGKDKAVAQEEKAAAPPADPPEGKGKTPTDPPEGKAE